MKRKKAQRQTAAETMRRHDAEIVSIVADTEAKPRLHCTLRMTDGSEVVVALKTLDLDRSGTSIDPSGVSFVDRHGNLRGVTNVS